MKDLFKNRKIKSRAKEIGIEEISLDSFLKKQKQDFEMYDKKIEVPLTKQVFLVFIFICFILFGLLWALCFHFHLFYAFWASLGFMF